MMTLKSKRFGLQHVRIAVLMGCALMIVGCSDLKPDPAPKMGAEQQPAGQTATSPSSAAASPPATAPLTRATTVVAYRLAANPDERKQADANGLVPTPVMVPAGAQDTAKIALMSLTSGPGSPLPPGTQLVGVKIDVASKLATVNFSHEFKTNFRGGESRESQTIESVLQTLGQFPTITKVQFLVDGRRIDTLGGSQDLDQPLPTPQSGQTLADGSSGV